MAMLPKEVLEAWEERVKAVVFATVDGEGKPNVIYATCVGLHDDQTIVVADNYFDKTRSNILNGSKGSILFITDDKRAYQIKGSIQYCKEGPLFDYMKSWNPEKHPGHAAAVLTVEDVYKGADKLV